MVPPVALAFFALLLFMDRRRRADEYPWLMWKVRLFVIGACLAVGGMVMDLGWLILLAIGVLAAGFLIRFLPGGTGASRDDGTEDGAVDEGRDEDEARRPP